jgi:hypothetical protein
MRGFAEFWVFAQNVSPWLENLMPSSFSLECVRNLHIKGEPFGVIPGDSRSITRFFELQWFWWRIRHGKHRGLAM